MKQGKHICNTLKAIRSEIASANEIDYTPTPCDHEGDCAGTCPACESEMRWIERQLRTRKALGKAVTIAGVSMALSLATSAAAQSPTSGGQKRKTEAPKPKKPDERRTAGVVRRPPNKEEEARRKAEEERRKMLEEQRKREKEEPVRGKIPMPPEKTENDSTCNAPAINSQFVAEGDTIITEDGREVIVRELTSGIVGNTGQLNIDSIYTDVDIEARFPDGDEAMNLLIKDQLYIPDEILEPIKEVSGTIKARCIVKALVERDGTISDAVIEKTTTADIFDQEALRAVKNLPPFLPARLYGAIVRSWKLIPVEFIYDFSNPEQTSEQGE